MSERDTTGPVMDDRSEATVDERATMCQHGHDADDCWMCFVDETRWDDDDFGED